MGLAARSVACMQWAASLIRFTVCFVSSMMSFLGGWMFVVMFNVR